MENNENKKSYEALADEALEKVAGGDGWPFKIQCHNCPRCDETVMYYSIKDENGGYGMNLCPDCVARIRKDHTVYEGFHLF